MTTQRSRPASLARLLRVARPEWPLLAVGMVFLAVGSAAGLAYPQAIKIVIDSALAGAGAGTTLSSAGMRLVNQAALAMFGLAVVTGIAVAVRYYCFSLAGERVVMRLRERLFRAILDQEIAFFDGQRTGDLVNRLASDTAVLQSAASAQISQALRSLATVAGGVALLFYTSPRLALAMLAVVPAVALGAVAYGRRIRRLSREVQEALGVAGEVAQEDIAGIRTVRSFDAEEREAARYAAALAAGYGLARRRVAAGTAFMAGAVGATYVSAALVIWYGGRLVVQGEMSPGGLTSFLVYTLLVAMSLAMLGDVWAEVMRAAGAAERIFDIQDRVPAIPTEGGATPARVQGQLVLEAVRFAYPARADRPVLQGIDLEIAPGEVVALVGPSGAGKSTVAALVARFYDPTGGAVRLDGRDLRELDPRWLRRQVGAVSQEPILFSGTIAENIRYGRPGASDAEVEAAARAANAHEFISGFSQGYGTQVGERGVQLSGGQKQRVAIARAVLKDPRVLVLDEATSALDAESEHLVRDALERLMKGRATLIIAHRLSTVVHADRVAVLDGGRIVQSGSHAALLAEDGLYRRLVERQFVAA
jgi:ATP-binding cassette subfamily B protein